MKTMMVMLSLLLISTPLIAQSDRQGTGLRFVETADGSRSNEIRELVQWTHTRLVFSKQLDRVAVGQSDILEVEVLGPQEVLILAKSVGRTSIIVWYPDQTTETFLFGVNTDLSVLREALKDIYQDIRLELAPDRAALVLRGTVPTVNFRIAAESAAHNYLNAERESSGSNALSASQNNAADLLANISNFSSSNSIGNTEGEIAIINLIQVEQVPLTTKVKVEEAISQVGGENVIVSRIRRGDLNNDGQDTLLLSGTVQTQVDLVRVLNIASRLFSGSEQNFENGGDLKVLANESGSLVGQGGGGSGSNSNSFLSGSGSDSLNNRIESNVGRAKLLSSADGRILSMIEVIDLPQVRVSVQMYEVSRSRMKNWRPDLSLVSSDFRNDSNATDGERIGASGSQIANALQVIGGSLSNQFQLGNSNIAFDVLFSMLEKEGISRTLSKPSLTVLAGEEAVFNIGGEVPVPSAFAPSGISTGDSVGSNTSGVFSGTEFRAFGVQLLVRPLVGEDDRITIDVNPTISMPDTSLTQSIANATGTGLNTTAFNTRSLNTTTRLRDGQPLVIGGLVSRDISEGEDYTPGLNKLPLIGKFAEASSKSDSDRELIIILTPSIIRDPSENTGLWEFPSTRELIQTGVGMLGTNLLQSNANTSFNTGE
ncbi:MAG: pilus assembly protein N-terminal domain-containing protein [Gammaproteobacteria bacterium]